MKKWIAGFLVEWDSDAPQSTKPVDLLALVDVKRDTRKGEWALAPGGLVSKKGDSFPILEIQQTPPAEYDFEIEFTIAEGAREVSQVLAVPGGNVFWQMGFGAAGDQTFFCFGPYLDAAKPDPRPEASLKRARLKDGQRYRSLVEVRKDSLRALIDGEEVLKWSGDFKRFGNPEGYCNFKDTTHLGLASYKCEVTFHKAELRPFGASANPSIGTLAAATGGSSMPAASPVEPLMPPELTALDEQFLKLKTERVTAPFDVEVTKLNTGYVGGIGRAIADEKKAGRLDGILALEAEKKLIEDKQPMPETDDAAVLPAIKTLRGIYRTAHAKLAATRDASLKALTEPLDKRLAQIETDMIKADRIADAKTVRTYRDALAKSSPGLQPVKTAAIPEPAPAVNSAGAAVYKDGYANTLGMNFVAVKNTDVLMCIHETRCKDWAAYAAENPRAGGTFKPRAVDGFTVTERSEDHPVTNTTWEQAHQFCEWLSKKEGKYYRLPTDREWSYAAGVGSNEKWRKDSLPSTITRDPDEFPWGKRWPPLKGSGNFSDESRKAKAPKKEARYLERYDDGFPTTAPVMSFDPNKLGIYDLSGNVWEWVEDYFNEKKGRALRGGGWETQDRGALLSSNRWDRNPGNGYDYYGFRIVLVPGGRPPEAADASPSGTR